MKMLYITKGLLIANAEKASEIGYNRQIAPEVLDDISDHRFPIQYLMTRRHKAGEPCEPHIRCMVHLMTRTDSELRPVVIDMPFDDYHSLPTIEVEDSED
jgi:hypothetical protein